MSYPSLLSFQQETGSLGLVVATETDFCKSSSATRPEKPSPEKGDRLELGGSTEPIFAEAPGNVRLTQSSAGSLPIS